MELGSELAVLKKVARHAWLQSWHLSLFEKVILVNSLMLIGEALAGIWVTSHHLEAQHYLIDTSFIVLATLLTLSINTFFLRASFRPLFSLLATIREVSDGETQARATEQASDVEIRELAQAFNSMLDRLETARREQTMLIIQAQEDERRRIALELHDEAGQNLTALLVHIEILKQNVQAHSTPAIKDEAQKRLTTGLQQLDQLTQLTLENVRLLSQQLRPGVLDDLGLMAALRWLAEDSQQRLHLDVILHLHMDERPHLPAAYETALFRIAQESLTNIARHAHAQHTIITLKQTQKKTLHLSIHDDGCGYDTRQLPTGSGIIGMRERATSLGGTLTLTSQPGQGTTVRAILPLPEHGQAAIDSQTQVQDTAKEREQNKRKDTTYAR